MVAEGLHRVLLDYPGVSCPKFVVMPNHFHGIFLVERADMESAPTLSQVIQAFKRYTTIQYVKLVKEGRAPSFDQRVWQRSFYDHVLRSEADYQRVWRYIDENPAKWAEDEYYSEGAIP
jgi:REP element-mobilizing transposase RayT